MRDRDPRAGTGRGRGALRLVAQMEQRAARRARTSGPSSACVSAHTRPRWARVLTRAGMGRVRDASAELRGNDVLSEPPTLPG